MKPKASKAIPFIAGFLILVLIAGFALGLRTVIEFDRVNAQMKTTKSLYLHLPVSIHKQELWFSHGDEPITPIEWVSMHEIHNSPAGTKIENTKWGSIVDTVMPWDELGFEHESKAVIAKRTLELINQDLPVKIIRVYILRVDAMLRYDLQDPQASLDPDAIDTIFNDAIAKPIED
ncbi:MAG: hypothetical protein JKX70_00575 [Phycisphaerales bacterium]|nr:hypothetical protein [Phycisphaerales bacterium]